MDNSQSIQKRNNQFNIFDCLNNKQFDNSKRRQFSHSFNRVKVREVNKLINSNNLNTITEQINLPHDLPKIIIDRNQFKMRNNDVIKRNSFDSIKDQNYEKMPLLENQRLRSDSLKKNFLLSSSTSSRWRKLSNFMKSITFLKSMSTKVINDDDEFDKNLKEYKERSTKHNSPIKSINNQPKPKEKKEFLFKAKSETNNELLRFYLKEEFLKLIFDRGSNLKESLDSLFELNPDRFSRDSTDKKFLYNELLHNGKNLMYIACREGNVEVLKYMLEKKMDPFILSRVSENEVESCLQVGTRWNNFKIVETLLDNVRYSKQEIKDLMNNNNLNLQLKSLFKRYLDKYFEQDEVTCIC